MYRFTSFGHSLRLMKRYYISICRLSTRGRSKQISPWPTKPWLGKHGFCHRTYSVRPSINTILTNNCKSVKQVRGEQYSRNSVKSFEYIYIKFSISVFHISCVSPPSFIIKLFLSSQCRCKSVVYVISLCCFRA